jgi:hypothetical protein
MHRMPCPTPVPHWLSLKEAGRAVVKHKHGQTPLSSDADPYFHAPLRFTHKSAALSHTGDKACIVEGYKVPGICLNQDQGNSNTKASRDDQRTILPNTTAIKSLAHPSPESNQEAYQSGHIHSPPRS